MNSGPLEVAIGASRPLPASNAEECRALLNQIAALRPRRLITVDDHRRWQETGRPPHCDDADISENLTASHQ